MSSDILGCSPPPRRPPLPASEAAAHPPPHAPPPSPADPDGRKPTHRRSRQAARTRRRQTAARPAAAGVDGERRALCWPDPCAPRSERRQMSDHRPRSTLSVGVPLIELADARGDAGRIVEPAGRFAAGSLAGLVSSWRRSANWGQYRADHRPYRTNRASSLRGGRRIPRSALATLQLRAGPGGAAC